jgi:hypothetical protein
MSATRTKPSQRTFTVAEAERSFVEIMRMVAGGITVHIVHEGREVCVMESPMDRADRMFRELKEREALEDDVPARLTRPQFFKD